MLSLNIIDRINRICDVVETEARRYPDCIEVYFFGSFLREMYPNDIDVLIVYDDSKCDVNDQINYLSQLIENISNYSVDVTALSENELQETSFLTRLNGNYLRIL